MLQSLQTYVKLCLVVGNVRFEVVGDMFVTKHFCVNFKLFVQCAIDYEIERGKGK